MELSQKQCHLLLVAGVSITVSVVMAKNMLQSRALSPSAVPTLVAAPASASIESTAFAAEQNQQWEMIFDPLSPVSQDSRIEAAAREYQRQSDVKSARKLKQLLVEQYQQNRDAARYEQALLVINRILALDGNFDVEEYWMDKNELGLAYLRAGQDSEGCKVIAALFDNVPSQMSAQEHLKGILAYYLQSHRSNEALSLLYRMVRYDKEHDWPLFLGYESFIKLAAEFEEQSMPTKAQQVYDLGLNVEVHRNQPWGQAQIMRHYAGFQERRGMKEQSETLYRNAQLIEDKARQDVRAGES